MRIRDLAASEVENKGAYEQAQAVYETTTAASLPEEIQKAEADVANAESRRSSAEQKLYESRQNLYNEGALPRKDLDQSRVSFTQAQTQYEIAVKHLSALQAMGKRQALKSAKGQLTSAEGKYLGMRRDPTRVFGGQESISGMVTDRPIYPGEMAPAGTPMITIMDTSKVIARAHIPQDEASFLKTGDGATIATPALEKPIVQR